MSSVRTDADQKKVIGPAPRVAAGKADGHDAYLSRWNESTGEVELVIGRYPW
jgi:hypothetical protein